MKFTLCIILQTSLLTHKVMVKKLIAIKHAGVAQCQKKIECLSTYLKRMICTAQAHYHYPTWQEDTLYQIYWKQ